MRRRDFIAATAGLAAWPVAARAQQADQPIVGFLHSGSLDFNIRQFEPAVAEGLKDQGYVSGRDVRIEARAAEGHYDRLPRLVAELIADKVSVLFAVGGTEPARVAKAAGTSLPIVFLSAADPIAAGLVASLAHPGGNVTGVTLLGAALEAKRLQILHELVPGAALVAAMINPDYPAADRQKHELESAARTLGLSLAIGYAGTGPAIDAAVADAIGKRAGALLVAQDPFLAAQQRQIVALAARHRLPAIYQQREIVEIGGLVSYGTDYAAAYRQAGNYIGRVLKGTRPADLPVVEASKFALAINMKTAKELGLAPPPVLLAAADDLIE